MIGVVRFWPAVIIPAVFSILFGPIIGGVGAALGIFISDMMIHGDALLSLTVGVPSNLLAFYLIGYINQINISKKIMIVGTAMGVIFALSSVLMYVFYSNYLGPAASLIFVGISLACVGLTIGVIVFSPNWRRVNIASVIGLGVGSIWIGVGVWVYSKFFVLSTGVSNISSFAALGWFIWTYFTEIPFLLLLVPPILKAGYKVFGNLRQKKNT